jgi:hypothetical protein
MLNLRLKQPLLNHKVLVIPFAFSGVSLSGSPDCFPRLSNSRGIVSTIGLSQRSHKSQKGEISRFPFEHLIC